LRQQVIAAALDRFYPKVLADPKLSWFFAGVDIDKLKIRIGAFFTMATGGPGGYAGPVLREVHARLAAKGLNDDVFDSSRASCKSRARRIATWLRSWHSYAALVTKC